MEAERSSVFLGGVEVLEIATLEFDGNPFAVTETVEVDVQLFPSSVAVIVIVVLLVIALLVADEPVANDVVPPSRDQEYVTVDVDVAGMVIEKFAKLPVSPPASS